MVKVVISQHFRCAQKLTLPVFFTLTPAHILLPSPTWHLIRNNRLTHALRDQLTIWTLRDPDNLPSRENIMKLGVEKHHDRFLCLFCFVFFLPIFCHEALRTQRLHLRSIRDGGGCVCVCVCVWGGGSYILSSPEWFLIKMGSGMSRFNIS